MIYADYNGSAPLLPVVREYLHKRLDSDLFANPNAIHSLGQKIAGGIEKCRHSLAGQLGCFPDQIFFNSGSSEGVTTILNSVLGCRSLTDKVVITSAVEHSVVLNGLKYYQQNFGLSLAVVNVTSDGLVDLAHLQQLMQTYQGQLVLVTIMAANNETGVLQPYQQMAKMCQAAQVEFFSDTTQLIGKGEFDFAQSGMDYAVCSGHKIGALPGSGFILVKEATKLKPLIFGGGQERGLRGGTQNYLGIETLTIAINDFHQQRSKLTSLQKAREDFEQEIKLNFPAAVIIAQAAPRLAGTTLIGYPGLHGQAVQIELESHDIFVTTSAACSDNEPETSKILKAMGIGDELGRSVVRISLSHSHGHKEYSALALALKAAYNKLIKIHSY